jgi:hypothetical protein
MNVFVRWSGVPNPRLLAQNLRRQHAQIFRHPDVSSVSTSSYNSLLFKAKIKYAHETEVMAL